MEKIQCNNCEKIYKQYELVQLEDKEGDIYSGCPVCKTDNYLQNIEPSYTEVFKTSAIKSEKGFKHFGINKKSASIYGCKPEEVLRIKFMLDTNQDTEDIEGPDYWGWFDYSKQRFRIIFAKRFILGMCFPYGMEAEEKVNKGRAYRLKLIN